MEQRQPYFDPDLYALADDLATVAATAASKITKAGDTGIGNLWIGGTSIGIPASLYDQYLVVAGTTYSSGQMGGIILQGYGGGNETNGEIIFAGGATKMARITCYAPVGGGSGRGNIRFYVKDTSAEVLGFEVVGAGKANFGDLTGTAAALLNCRNYAIGTLSTPVIATNLGTTVNTAVAYSTNFSGTTGVIMVGGHIQWKKTVNDSTTTITTDSIISVNQASASQTEMFYVRGLGGVAERFRSSTSDPTTTNVPTGIAMRWHNTSLNEMRIWYNIGGTLYKGAVETLTPA